MAATPGQWWWEQAGVPCHVDVAALDRDEDEIGLVSNGWRSPWLPEAGNIPFVADLDEAQRGAGHLAALSASRRREAEQRRMAAMDATKEAAEELRAEARRLEEERAERLQKLFAADPRVQRLFAIMQRERERLLREIQRREEGGR